MVPVSVLLCPGSMYSGEALACAVVLPPRNRRHDAGEGFDAPPAKIAPPAFVIFRRKQLSSRVLALAIVAGLPLVMLPGMVLPGPTVSS